MFLSASWLTKPCAARSLSNGPTSSLLLAFKGVVYAVRPPSRAGAWLRSRANVAGRPARLAPPATCTQ